MTNAGKTAGNDHIAVIVVNYGTADLAIKAVESVLSRQHGNRRVDIYLVDNASPGDDVDKLKEAQAANNWGTAVTLLVETENHGFGRGNNVVLRQLNDQADRPDKVFLLNPDARLENEAIDLLAAALDDDPCAAAAGASILRPDRTRVTAAFRFPGPANELARMINIGRLNQMLRHRLVLLPPLQPSGPVDWVSGASVMFRFSAVREVDFFDPDFFLYFEEVDLMRRLKQNGWRVLYETKAQVVHEEGAATGQFAGGVGRQRNPAYLYQSWEHYFKKAYGRIGVLPLALMMLPAALLNILHRRLRGQNPTVPLDFIADHIRYVILPLLVGRGSRHVPVTKTVTKPQAGPIPPRECHRPATMAAVVIGRNEGPRLTRCLTSLKGVADPIVYVDSGSTDASIAVADAAGAMVVELDKALPFTAARARNAGLAHLNTVGCADYVQVIDGDCELLESWPSQALAFLEAHQDVAMVAGRLRERFPEASLWNRLADAEWNTPVGQTQAVGGIAVLRRAPVVELGGYRDTLIAGEEPELCLRLCRAGWKIWRLEVDMALHDIGMTRISQWWLRMRRYGHAIAEGAFLHGQGPERYCVPQVRRTLIWGIAIPLLAVAGCMLSPVVLLVLLVWPAQVLRLKRRGKSWEQAFFLMLGKLPEAQGILGYHLMRLRGSSLPIIEYK